MNQRLLGRFKKTIEVSGLETAMQEMLLDDTLIWRGVSRRKINQIAEELNITVRINWWKDKYYIIRVE